MPRRRNNLLSYTSIILGVIFSLIYLFNILFIDYFSSIGPRESASTFLFSILLILSGIANLRNLSLGIILLWGYVVGSIIERVLVSVLYYEYVTIDIIFPPIISSIIIAGLLFYSKSERIPYKRSDIIITLIVSLVIALLPKVLF